MTSCTGRNHLIIHIYTRYLLCILSRCLTHFHDQASEKSIYTKQTPTCKSRHKWTSSTISTAQSHSTTRLNVSAALFFWHIPDQFCKVIKLLEEYCVAIGRCKETETQNSKRSTTEGFLVSLPFGAKTILDWALIKNNLNNQSYTIHRCLWFCWSSEMKLSLHQPEA